MPMTTNGIHTSEEAAAKPSDDVMDLFQSMPDFATFDEVHNSIAAMLWIKRLEDIFNDFINCQNEHKVACAVSMLRSGALVWWDSVQNLKGLETTTKMTWNELKEVFKDRFYPISMEMGLVDEYITLEQGPNQTVKEITSRFEELWWFYWDYLTPEQRLIYRFVRVLKDDIKKFISPSDMTSFKKVVNAARVVENENNRRLEARNNGKRKWKSRKCSNCGKTHEGECRYGSDGCYRCGELGHLARECPSKGRKCNS